MVAVPSAPDPDPAARLARLRNELRGAHRRYGIAETPVQLSRLELAVDRRRNRIDHLNGQVAELQEEIALLTAEIDGYAKGLEALLSDELERIKERYGEAWSPSAVLGFRLWNLNDGRLEGARVPWTEPRLRARCPTTNTNPDEVPHSDGRCGRLGCGIYAAKEIAPLLRELTHPRARHFVAGLVALTGKVVEHERGYRGAVADVVAVAAVGASRVYFCDHPDEIAEIFRNPEPIMGGPGRGEPAATAQIRDVVARYLNDQLRRRIDPWTSVSNIA